MVATLEFPMIDSIAGRSLATVLFSRTKRLASSHTPFRLCDLNRHWRRSVGRNCHRKPE